MLIKQALSYIILTVIMATFGWYEWKQGWAEGFQRGEEAYAITHKFLKGQTFSKTVVPAITACESGNRQTAVGDGGKAYGVAQFHERTFNWMRNESGVSNLSYKNESDQRWLLEWAIKHGYGNHWGRCYRKAVKTFAQEGLPLVVAEAGVPINLVQWEVKF